ncbi:hypothetical protein JT358_05235 [Micrococcales bacterium 31B]|nr:hypothetical protein [Micrococcales bacterium 31B]
MRRTAWYLPAIVVFLALGLALTERTVAVTRILGEGENIVGYSQFCIAPAATLLYAWVIQGNARRERSSAGRAQTMALTCWLAATLAGGAIPLGIGYLADSPLLRVAGLSYVGLTGLAGLAGYLTLPHVGTAMPILYLAMSFIFVVQAGGPLEIFWPITLDVDWTWAWTAVAAWLAGTWCVAKRPTRLRCRVAP